MFENLVSESSKIYFLEELVSSFPKTAEKIFKSSEIKCQEENDLFEKLASEEKTEQIIKKIFSEEIVEIDIELLIESANFLEKLEPESLIDNFFETLKKIQSETTIEKYNPLLIISNNNLKNEINNNLKLIDYLLESFFTIDLELGIQVNRIISYLNRLKFIENYPEIVSLKKDLAINLTKISSLQEKLTEAYRYGMNKQRKYEKIIIQINEVDEKKALEEKFRYLEKEINEISKKQREIIIKTANMTLTPKNQLAEMISLFNEFSSYLVCYPVLRNFKSFSEKFKEKTEYEKRVSVLEKNFQKNLELFLKEVSLFFKKNLPNIKDKKAHLEQFFLKPISDKLNKNEYIIILDLIDSVV